MWSLAKWHEWYFLFKRRPFFKKKFQLLKESFSQKNLFLKKFLPSQKHHSPLCLFLLADAGYDVHEKPLYEGCYWRTSTSNKFSTRTYWWRRYLGLGQLIVGLIQNPETVNSTSRLTYFVFIMVGMFGELGVLGDQLKEIVMWSPHGTVKRIIAAGMQPGTWNSEMTTVLFVTIGYAILFQLLV